MKVPESIVKASGDALKQMNEKDLLVLCSDIRNLLIEVTSANGGHLASNLGAVELTVALHRVFDSPVDKMVWDVGHQCYVHKLLTGRAEQFDTLRQYGGLSGFPKREESEHDVFDTGHSSTSLSAAIGLACAQEAQNIPGKVIAVIGDGAMTGGMVYEAMNQIGSLKKPMVIVLNDNDMSISPNVGALHYHLSRFRSGGRYVSLKRKMSKHFPRTSRVLERIKNSVKYLLLSSSFFEELGIKYIGPIDGHDIAAMEKIFERVKHFDAPVLVHVLTTKGKGYAPAESQPQHFHGISGANQKPMTEIQRNTSRSIVGNAQVFSEELCRLAAVDERIVAITAAMAEGTGLQTFAQQYPERFYDVGIAEQHAMTFAAGMAAGGMKPALALYSTFLQRAYDQLLHDVCLQKLPVLIGVDRCGPVGEDGPTHHGVYDISYLMQMPHLTLFSPSNQADLRRMVREGCAANGPTAVRYPRQPLPIGEEGEEDIYAWKRWGDWKPLVILATGQMVETARQTAELLRSNGLLATLVDARCLRPMDTKMLMEIAAHGEYLVTLEDGIASGGLGEHVVAWLAGKGAPMPKVLCLAMPEEPLPHGDMTSLFAHGGLMPFQLHGRIQSWVEDRNAYKKQA